MAVDALIELKEAIEKAGSTDGSKIAQAIEQISGLQALTGVISYDSKTHNPLNKPAVIQQIKGGDFIFVQTYVTE